ncbi:MAG: FAD-dependent oxidoreductase [Phycisphaerae bacterium]|nr:FAD-dependent oxidoreductase [Phycisphaerae bacterium]
MKYDYDVITIGLGPAGMAVAVMGAEMGLKVCAIEKHRLGGECMNVGCIPSKSLLRMAKARSIFGKLEKLGLAATPKPAVVDPFPRIGRHLKFISEKKTMKMFDKVDMLYQQGYASFVDKHTVEVAGKRYTARRIFICAGTRPATPSFDGIEDVEYLTNDTIFSLDTIPGSMIVVGGGAIACEMAQAFSRLGCEVTVIIRGPRLMWRQSPDATDIIEETFEREGITILRERKPVKFERSATGHVVMHTDDGEQVVAEKVLVAAGRRMAFDEMKLENAGVKYTDKGIAVNRHLQTSQRNIYACGDCNSFAQFSHAAMHQGMIAIMNSMMPLPFRKDYRKFVVPWTVFTDPQFSHVGLGEQDLKERGIKYEVITAAYGDYGAAIAETVDVGHVKALVSKAGRIYGVDIIGEGSGEMINEWTLAIQNKLRLHKIMMTQHSFPTMGFLTKRLGEMWMMNRMKSKFLKSLCRFMFRH